MKILLVTPFALSTTGGITTVVRNLAREFAASGHTAAILGPGTTTRVSRIGEDAGVPVFGCYLREPFVRAAPLVGAAAFALKYPWTLWRLHRFLRRERIDAVIVQYPLANHSYFGVLRPWSSWTLLVTFQGNDAHDLGDRRPFERTLLRVLLARADRITGVSRSLLKKVDAAFPGLAAKAALIPNGASAPSDPGGAGEWPSLPERFIIAVGQLIHRKGIDTLIRALGVLRRRSCHVDAVLVGDGEERANLESLARAEGVSDRVHFMGTLPSQHVFRLVNRALLLTLPSRAEGLPLVAVEAMSLGRPVVGSRTDGIADLIEAGRTGLLVEVDDDRGLADAIQQLVDDDRVRTAMGERARAVAQARFTWRRIAEEYAAAAGGGASNRLELAQTGAHQ